MAIYGQPHQNQLDLWNQYVCRAGDVIVLIEETLNFIDDEVLLRREADLAIANAPPVPLPKIETYRAGGRVEAWDYLWAFIPAVYGGRPLFSKWPDLVENITLRHKKGARKFPV